jgi:alcohol dehydrogenase (quinone), cytochrome c subunit
MSWLPLSTCRAVSRGVVAATLVITAMISFAAGPVIDNALIERGRYLADAANCSTCHTQEGAVPYSGGVPFRTPVGVIYSSNITPDLQTGIGKWSLDEFRRALHEGIAPDGSRLFPAFPYTSFTKMADADVAAIYAYLGTVKAARYAPPQNDFTLRQRWALRAWNSLFFTEGRFSLNPTRSQEWNRGAYLVEALGHCGACHTPRNALLAEIDTKAYQGGLIQEEVTRGKVRNWSAVNLNSVKGAGLALWSVADLEKYLKKGFCARAGTFGPMNEVIVNSLSKLTAEDIHAMAVYVKSLTGDQPGESTDPPDTAKAGAAIYAERCEKCHLESGRGGMFSGPPVAGSAIVLSENPASLINIILYGPELPKSVSFGGWETMKPYGDVLDDAQVAAVANYLRSSWGNRARTVSADDVARQR